MSHALDPREGLFQNEDSCETEHALTSQLHITPITDSIAGVAQLLALSETSERESKDIFLFGTLGRVRSSSPGVRSSAPL